MGGFSLKPRNRDQMNFRSLILNGYKDPFAAATKSVGSNFGQSSLPASAPPEEEPEFVGPTPPTEVQKLEMERDARPKLWQRFLKVGVPAAGIALGGIFGGEAGATGAAMGANEALRYGEEVDRQKKTSLQAAIENAKQREAQQEEKRMSLMAAVANQKAQQQQHAQTLEETIRHNQAVESQPVSLGEGNVLVDRGSGKVIAQGAPKPESMQRIAGTVNGVATIGNYNPKTGTISNYRGEDISADFKPKESEPSFNLSSGAGNDQALVESIIANPLILDRMPGKTIERISPALAAAGFTEFGKSMPAGAIKQVSDTQSAISSLKDLRSVLLENEQYIGPVAGLQAYNPWSGARTAQAKIDLVKQRVGKALEGGVLRKEDEEKYKKILATLQDTPTTAITKVDSLISTLENDMELFLEEQKRAGKRVDSSNKTPPAAAKPASLPSKKSTPGATIKFDAQGKRIR